MLPATNILAVCVPEPPPSYLATFTAPPVAHAPIGAPGPVHSSTAAVAPEGRFPDIANALDVVPTPPSAFLPVFKSVVSVQLVPFQISVRAL